MTDSAVFADLDGTTLLDNDRVLVQRFVAQPGRSLGAHSHIDAQLLVYVRGGDIAGADGRVTIWRDGRVRWFDAAAAPADGGTNVGASDIVVVVITLKACSDSGVTPPSPPVGPLHYPNVPGEDLLDNDHVVVQRFVIEPGQWEGVHAHQPNMLYVHLTTAHWAARTYERPAQASPPAAVGDVGWMDPVELDVGHESANVGTDPIDFIWVSLKR